MSLKFKLLEGRVTQLEREVCRLYKAVQAIAKETKVDLTETNELLGIPPYDPGMKDEPKKR